jgi:hypothetical protein
MDFFLKMLKQEKLPVPETEYKFCPDRRWRFDYAYPQIKLAIEQEGGVWSGGRHTSGAGFIKDMEKYNKAVILGWRVLRYTPDQMLNEAIDDIRFMTCK